MWKRLIEQLRNAQRNQLLENVGEGIFVDSSDRGPGLALVQVSRGAAFGDLDGDGDLDIAVNNSNDRPALLRNDADIGGWLGLRLKGAVSNRDAIGARIALTTNGRTLVREVRRNASYLSSNDPRVLFGLGEAEVAERVEIRWPSGAVQILEALPGRQYVAIEEGTNR